MATTKGSLSSWLRAVTTLRSSVAWARLRSVSHKAEDGLAEAEESEDEADEDEDEEEEEEEEDEEEEEEEDTLGDEELELLADGEEELAKRPRGGAFAEE